MIIRSKHRPSLEEAKTYCKTVGWPIVLQYVLNQARNINNSCAECHLWIQLYWDLGCPEPDQFHRILSEICYREQHSRLVVLFRRMSALVGDMDIDVDAPIDGEVVL